VTTPDPHIRERRVARHREQKRIVEYLKSDLYERNRDYSESSFQIGPVEYDSESEMLWGSPLGWRVTVKVSWEDDALMLTVHSPDGTLFAASPPFRDHGYDEGVNWLEEWLP